MTCSCGGKAHGKASLNMASGTHLLSCPKLAEEVVKETRGVIPTFWNWTDHATLYNTLYSLTEAHDARCNVPVFPQVEYSTTSKVPFCEEGAAIFSLWFYLYEKWLLMREVALCAHAWWGDVDGCGTPVPKDPWHSDPRCTECLEKRLVQVSGLHEKLLSGVLAGVSESWSAASELGCDIPYCCEDCDGEMTHERVVNEVDKTIKDIRKVLHWRKVVEKDLSARHKLVYRT